MRKLSKVLAIVLVLCLSLTMFAGCGDSSESTFPERSISMIVPFGAGGGTDVVGRLLAEGMAESLGVSIQVTNVAGGTSGSTGVMQVWSAAHDGYTICATSETPLLIPVQVATVEQTSEDWIYFVGGGSAGLMAINTDYAEANGITTLADLSAYSDKESINIAGTTGGLWFALAQLIGVGGWDFNWVSYGGSADAITATVGGKDAQIVVASEQEINQYVISGDLTVLAHMDTESYAGYPAITDEIPSIASYFPLGQWLGFKIPADTDPEIVAIYEAAFKDAVASDGFIEYCEANCINVFGYYGDEAAAFVANSESILANTLYDLGVEGVLDPSTKGID